MLWCRIVNAYIKDDYIHFNLIDTKKYNCKISMDSMRWVEIELPKSTYFLPIEKLDYKLMLDIKNNDTASIHDKILNSLRFSSHNLTDYLKFNRDEVKKKNVVQK